MALTNPPSPAASDGSSNSVSSGPPRTPESAEHPPLKSESHNAGGVKRTSKPNRRANTAERRATHNAVERQRRETLNGRFLDLAGLLPNLSQIRRPSKSAIVNSSIAHVNASRRQRMMAAAQLRSLKHECDELRHEVNQWRMRSGMPCVEEPVRSEAFSLVLSGELEVDVSELLEGDEEDEDDEYPPTSAPARPYPRGQPASGFNGAYGGEREDFARPQHPADVMGAARYDVPQTISIGVPQRQSHSPPQYASPMIASPTMAPPPFDPSLVYDTGRHLHHHQQMMLQQHQQHEESDKWAFHNPNQMRPGPPVW